MTNIQIRIGYAKQSGGFHVRAYVATPFGRVEQTVTNSDSLAQGQVDLVRKIQRAYAQDGMEAPMEVRKAERVPMDLLNAWIF